MRDLIAWMCFVAGCLFLVVDLAIPPFQPTGLSVLATALLLVWAALIGAFRAAFWDAAPPPPDTSNDA